MNDLRTAAQQALEALEGGADSWQRVGPAIDALRAALLEAAGYEARVFEFISPEHTSKNLMISAVRRTAPHDTAEATRRAVALAAFYGIRNQRLAHLLRIPLAA